MDSWCKLVYLKYDDEFQVIDKWIKSKNFLADFRGFKARKEMGIQKKNGKEDPSKAKKVAPKRKEPMTEKEAARIIQYYWKKWKKNSVFQQLLFCRAEKQQQLTYFCQQVHTRLFLHDSISVQVEFSLSSILSISFIWVNLF